MIEKKIIYVNKNVIEKTKIFLTWELYISKLIVKLNITVQNLCNLDIVDGVSLRIWILCGSKLVIRNFTNRDDYVKTYYFNEILYDLEYKTIKVLLIYVYYWK